MDEKSKFDLASFAHSTIASCNMPDVKIPRNYRNHIFYYYLRNLENAPVVTVCFLAVYRNGLQAFTARGIAVKSPDDKLDKKAGRACAIRWAGRAIKAQKNVGQIVKDTPWEIMKYMRLMRPKHAAPVGRPSDLFGTTVWHGYFNPKPNKLEILFLENADRLESER